VAAAAAAQVDYVEGSEVGTFTLDELAAMAPGGGFNDATQRMLERMTQVEIGAQFAIAFRAEYGLDLLRDQARAMNDNGMKPLAVIARMHLGETSHGALLIGDREGEKENRRLLKEVAVREVHKRTAGR
jgi:hypothetical protein